MPKWRIEHKGVTVLESRTCLKPLADPAGAAAFLSLYRHYKNGHLFSGGGILEQPKYYIGMMELLDWYMGDG